MKAVRTKVDDGAQVVEGKELELGLRFKGREMGQGDRLARISHH